MSNMEPINKYGVMIHPVINRFSHENTIFFFISTITYSNFCGTVFTLFLLSTNSFTDSIKSK